MVPFSLPSFAPSNLQHNLLSYLVRRFLGPLLKNGAESLDNQLATPTIPGNFTLKDVQLNPDALADHLSGAFSSFSIQEVSVSELSLQINWPSWSFSLQGYVPDVKVTFEGIQVTLGLSEHQSNCPSLLPQINLEESLATIANDFVHQELAESSAYDDRMDQDFPGAFTTRTNPNLPPSSSDEDQLGFFAGLVQKILAKFNFELNHFTLLFKHQALELLLSIDHIKSLDLTADDVQPSSSISREIRTSCPVIYLQHLSDQAQADSLPSPCNSTSTQSYDSEHDMLMSQATVDLRRPGSLFVSAAEIQNPIQEQLPDKTPLSQSIMKPENILLQFMSGTLTNETAEVSKSSTNSPLSSEAKPSHEDSEELLNPNNSLRFLFWVFHNSSSASTDEAPLDTDKPDSTGPSKQDTTPQSSPQRPRLNIQIDLPLVELSIRLPRDLNALTCLVSTFNSAIPSTSTDSASNVPTSASPTPSLIISAVLRLRALNCTLAFPTPYPQSLPRCDNTPLSSLNVQAHVINLVFNALPAYPVNQDQATQPQYELTLRVDKIKGRSEIRHMQSSTCHNSVFLLAPARDDHLCPAVCISRTVETVQIVFSSIWLNLDLEVVAFLIPLVKALQSTPVINRMSSRNLSGKVVGDQTILPSSSSGLSHTSLEDEYGNLKEDDNFKTTVSIPCLYVDIKSPTQRQPSHDRSQPDLILGLVLKTFQLIITSQKQIGCSAFQVALGFRIGHTAEERAHAPLSPFLGIAHSCIPSSTDQQNRFPGLRLTHILSHPQSQKLARNPSGPQRPTSIKLETVTIDLSKDQFDRLQYWIDDLGQWANSLFIDPPPTPFDRHTQPSSLDDTNTQRSGSRSGLETRLEKMRVDNDKDAVPSLLASLTVSKIALTIRLPPDNLQPKREAAPFKLVIQLELISIDQFRLPFHDEFNDQTRLLIRTCSASIHPQHQQPNTQSLPILYQAHPHLPKVQDKSSVSSAVSVEVNTATQPQAVNQQLSRKKILVNVHVNHSIVRLGPCCIWTSELARFLKAPAGVFEAVGPEYQSRINFELIGCAIQLVSPSPPPLSPASTTATTSSACDFQSGNDHGPYPDSSFILQVMADHAQLKLALDPSSTTVSPSLSASIAVSLAECPASILSASPSSPSSSEKIGFAPIIALNDLYVSLVYSWTPGRPTSRTILHRGSLAVSLCADSADSLAEAISRFSEISFQAKQDAIHNDVQVSSENQRGEDPIVASTMLRSAMREPSSLPRSILIQKDEDLIEEDYPTDVAFLDQAQPASSHHHPLINHSAPAILRSISGQGLNIIDDYLLRTPASSSKVLRQAIETEVQVEQLDVLVRFHDGYDWSSTRQTIQQAQKTVRKRLQKIRQLLATGNPADARSIEEDLGPTTLFKSLHLGLDSSTRGLSTAQLLDAIDDQLVKEAVEPVSDDPESMAGSWQSLTPHPPNELPQPRLVSVPSSKQRQLCRSTQPMLKIVLDRVQGHFRKYYHDRESGDTKASDSSDCRLSSLQLKTDTLTIIDNIPTSTWKKFLTELRPGEGGMMRPTGAPMVRVKFVVTPSARDFCLKEAIVKLKISPLRLYVDQDAVDFLKTFFSFQKSPSSSAPIPSIPDSSAAPPANGELFFQRVEILPIRIKLDYKPKRVNYMALKEGKAIELMNFFHFEGSDMVLRHATLTGISRASKIGELLQEIWTPDVKANQLADVISGIAPVRSVVNLGTGIADLVLLPIEEMKKKDGRLSRGIQKGTSSFAKNTTLEVIKLGARLAIGTQVVLEKAESILGAKFHQELCGETIEHLPSPDPNLATSDHHPTGLASHHHQHELVSRYALQPENFKVGAQSALHDLRDNFRSTAQTILAVPLEVFNEGSGQAVVKAIPIAILHPMVGATGAISKTLLGLHNSLDPLGSTDHRLDKYKQLHLPSSSSSSSKSSPSPS